jgi:hypothetical protein
MPHYIELYGMDNVLNGEKGQSKIYWQKMGRKEQRDAFICSSTFLQAW